MQECRYRIEGIEITKKLWTENYRGPDHALKSGVTTEASKYKLK
jgi:hypothetical protein